MQTQGMIVQSNPVAVNVLLTQLGSEIIRDLFYQGVPWEQLSLVINLDKRKQMFGYVYSNGDWEAISPDGIEPLETAVQLREAMQLQGNVQWKKCLVTINQATKKIDIDFDYQGTKWVPDMADPESFALSLKPEVRG